MVLRNNTFTSFADTGTLLDRKKVVPVTSWDVTSKQIKEWAVLCAVLLGESTVHPDNQELKDLIN